MEKSVSVRNKPIKLKCYASVFYYAVVLVRCGFSCNDLDFHFGTQIEVMSIAD